MSGRLKLQIRRYGRAFVILLALMALGTACGFYILLQQRLPNPFQSFYAVNAEFSSVAAVVPGLGEPVNVAGVHVGEITGTSLHGGRGILHMEIDPAKLKRLYRDAQANLVPNTPLKDMEVDISPGHPSAGVLGPGATIPVAQTTVPVDSDDLLDSLDADTRTWFTSLVTELNDGSRGRASDIRALLHNLGPTSAQLRQIGDLLAARRSALARIVHNLGVVSRAAATRDTELASAVQAGEKTVGALASQNAALADAVRRLPGTLASAHRTLGDVATLAGVLGPTATALVPTARRLPTTLRDSRTLFEAAALLPLHDIPPFVQAVIPLARQLPPLGRALKATVPALLASFKVLAYVTNEIAYVPGTRNPGFLYWTAWFAHNADSFLSNSDANGPVWRALVLTTCAGLKSFSFGPLVETLLGTNFGCKP